MFGYAVFGRGDIFLGLGRLLGVGTVYVTSLENFEDVLIGVGVASFIFRRRVTFLFHVAAAYILVIKFFVEFPPFVLVQGAAETVVLSPLVLLQGVSFLDDCRGVRP